MFILVWRSHNLFQAKYDKDIGVVMTGQNPETHPHSTAGNSWLPCIIKKCGIMFSLKHKRWLTGKELLAIHGYPIYESIFGESSSFNEERSAHGGGGQPLLGPLGHAREAPHLLVDQRSRPL